MTSVVYALAAWALAPSATQDAVADGETRTLHLYHTHTMETIDATFRVDGHYDATVLRQLNHFLRDWRNNDEIDMDPRLFDAIWEAYRTAGATDRIQIYSAYRSPETNAMLRRRSKAVAEHSQHMLGRAMDTTMPGFPMHRIREAAMKLEHGGVGWYPSANFVHIDVGGVRSWPRMSYDQLMALFPDGKTVHIASNGQTLPGYEQARVELAQRGQTELPPSQEDSGGFFAWLFGGGSSGSGAAHEDEEDRRVAVASAAPAPQPAVAPQPEPQPAQPASPQGDVRYQAQAQAPAAPQPEPVAQPAALAYAATPPQADAGQPAPVPQGTQVASLEPTATPIDAPLPPRRPASLVAIETEVPLPPVRPGAIDAVQPVAVALRGSDVGRRHTDPIGNLITATASGVPAIRRAALPSLITQGSTHGRARDEALAFAPSDATATESPLDLRPATPPGLRPMALRSSVVHRHHGTVSATADASSSAPASVSGPHVTGLRRAAQLMAKASL